ncbi:hypothetical protein [Paenibacillus odorifer]|uniref:hypothetical protein n=1 Tax=Paenibacillus odorifer TaxID=189426 RepID=UPI00096F5DBE|nr:hypothetical protein [Paenibacillus odorifer]OMD67628.1 hypothetical protein BSK50_30120 [Paenibacillus odorifer]
MKRDDLDINVFDATIKKKSYQIQMKNERERVKKHFNGGIKIFSCRVFEVLTEKELLIPLKRFDIVFDCKEQIYSAWTGDVISDEERAIRNEISNLFNNNILKLIA